MNMPRARKSVKALQQGFTLIELMIVVAIIGILAAVAIPAYQDYTIKGRISEVSSLIAPALAAAGVSCSNNTLASATTNNALGIPAPASITGKYVAGIAVLGQGTSLVSLTATLQPLASLGSASGGTVIYTGTCGPGGLSWVVTGNIQQKYLPKS